MVSGGDGKRGTARKPIRSAIMGKLLLCTQASIQLGMSGRWCSAHLRRMKKLY